MASFKENSSVFRAWAICNKQGCWKSLLLSYPTILLAYCLIYHCSPLYGGIILLLLSYKRNILALASYQTFRPISFKVYDHAIDWKNFIQYRKKKACSQYWLFLVFGVICCLCVSIITRYSTDILRCLHEDAG